MDNKFIYTLKMFSSLLVKEPNTYFDGLDLIIELKGYDDNDNYSECIIKFINVIGFEYSLVGFGIISDAYDKVIEICNSDWLRNVELYNQEKFNYWKPKHYALYIDDYGLYQVLANNIVVREIN